MKARLTQIINSAAFSEFSIIAGWLFLIMTGASLGLATLDLGTAAVWLNLGFNVLYVALYLAFLVAYAFLHRRPNQTYMFGITTFTFGYVFFVGLCATNALMPDQQELLQIFYILGSLSFLTGSLALAKSTLPRSKLSLTKDSLFLGSMCFLIGSVFLLLDAILTQSIVLLDLVILGMAVFLPGRLFFLLGSSDQNRTIFLRKPIAKRRGA